MQAAATLIAATHTYEARWDPSTTFVISEEWPVGSYLLKLVASTGQQRWVPLTVRDDASTATYVIENAVTTWQAYNRWGGCSLYLLPGRARPTGRRWCRSTVPTTSSPTARATSSATSCR